MPQPNPSKDTTIPLGSQVRVVNGGLSYSSYASMARFMRLDNWGDQQTHALRSATHGGIYTVVAKALHETESYGEVLGLQDEAGNQFMIGINGVRLSAPLSISGQVAQLEAQLKAVTTERDELKEQIAAVRRLFIPV